MANPEARRSALLVIDVQNGILAHLTGKRGEAARRALDETVARIAGLLARARAAGMPVLHVQHDGPPEDEHLAVGSEGWRIRAELAPRAGEALVHKTACDAFFGTDLEAKLRARGIDHLVVAGCQTQYCIDTTVRRAVGLGFDVALVADGHMTGDGGGLSFEQIVAFHNATLDGFEAGGRSVAVRPCAALP